LARGKSVVIGEEMLGLMLQGKVKVVEGKKLKLGRYRIVKRYLKV